jgi:hypothetical protein
MAELSSIKVVRCDLLKCRRWQLIAGSVLRLTAHTMNEYLTKQELEDAYKIAKHLKMGAKEIGSELHLEAAADWEEELKKKWTLENLFKIFEAIGLKDHEAWIQRYIKPSYQYHYPNDLNPMMADLQLLVRNINGDPMLWELSMLGGPIKTA